MNLVYPTKLIKLIKEYCKSKFVNKVSKSFAVRTGQRQEYTLSCTIQSGVRKSNKIKEQYYDGFMAF